jgi:hypothetical protein
MIFCSSSSLVLIFNIIYSSYIYGCWLFVCDTIAGYSKIFATLGLVCKCCDNGIEGACKETWTDSCSNIQCLPWKTH